MVWAESEVELEDRYENAPEPCWCQRMKSLLKYFRGEHREFPAARRRCDVVFVMAVAEGEWAGVEDLLDSLRVYLDCDWQVVAVDDATEDGSYEKLLDAGCWVVRNPRKGHLFGLHLTLCRGFLEALRLFESPIVVKIDPDALVIGPGLFETLRAAFAADERSGLLGTFRIDWNGQPRDLSYWRDRMARHRADLGRPLRLAIENGYVLGEGVQGGCYALRQECLRRIRDAGWLRGAEGYRPKEVKGHQIAEDSLITMLAYAAGYEARDIGGPGQPFGLWDVGLPTPPEELVAQNRMVTHSIKYRDAASLAAREYFRARRRDARASSAAIG